MRILLVHPPYRCISTDKGVGHQTPLGLLSIGGPLIDAGHTVRLVDAELRHLDGAQLAQAIAEFGPDVVMTGHSGSTPAHTAAVEVMRVAKAAAPRAVTVYGGVYPTYHAEDILGEHPFVAVIVRGEGEAVALALVQALAAGTALTQVAGITHRVPLGATTAAAQPAILRNPDAPMIRQLDDWRVGWELIDDWDAYQCFGIGRAIVYQFSRGCPHQCSYCGQYQFWERWRYRSPKKAAQEIARLHREHGVRFIDLADENPTSSRRLWREFLQAIVDEGIDVKLFATIRATDIVRDADLLGLARRAGMVCVLMGIETTDPHTLAAIRKGSTTAEDQQAVALLRQAGILSMLGHIVGFEQERWRDYRHATRQILLYDPDLLNAMYVTPHRWSDFAAEQAERLVIQEDPVKWDYRHQVLHTRHLRPWQVFWLVKWMELRVHLRPRALWRLLAHPDAGLRRHLRWCFAFSARVWLHEVAQFVFGTRFARPPRPLKDWFRARHVPATPVQFKPRASRPAAPHAPGSTDPTGTG